MVYCANFQMSVCVEGYVSHCSDVRVGSFIAVKGMYLPIVDVRSVCDYSGLP